MLKSGDVISLVPVFDSENKNEISKSFFDLHSYSFLFSLPTLIDLYFVKNGKGCVASFHFFSLLSPQKNISPQKRSQIEDEEKEREEQKTLKNNQNDQNNYDNSSPSTSPFSLQKEKGKRKQEEEEGKENDLQVKEVENEEEKERKQKKQKVEKNKVEEKTEKKETAGNDNNIINEGEGRLENERESEYERNKGGNERESEHERNKGGNERV